MCKSLASTAITHCVLLLAGVILLDCTPAQSDAQDILPHYFRSRQNVTYSPTTPFDANRLARIHMGYTGFFFNCDGEEDKRCSPYITWYQQPEKCREPGPLATMKQQWNEVKQRINWGSCCRFCSKRNCKGCKTRHGSGILVKSDSRSQQPSLQIVELETAFGTHLTGAEIEKLKKIIASESANSGSVTGLILPMLNSPHSKNKHANFARPIATQLEADDAAFRMTRSTGESNLK